MGSPAPHDDVPRPPAQPGDEHLRTDHLLGDIRGRTVRGGAITLATQLIKAVAQFASVIILVRLLPPSAFGLIAMVGAISLVLEPIRELGLSWSTMQKNDLTHAQISTLFWCNAGAGALVATALFAAAGPVAVFYGQPELVAVTRCLALTFLISGFGAQHCALLRRQMRFGSIALLETSAELASFAAAIGLALGGAGYWALVAQRLLSPAITTLGAWILCGWRPSRPAASAGAGELLSFGGSLAATSVVALAARSLDQISIGWWWGATVLGFYERASKLLLSPLNNITIPLYSVGVPALSRLQAEDRYRRAFSELVEKLAMLTFPAGAVIVVTADWITELLFGPSWSAAAPLLAYFGLMATYRPTLDAIGLLYMTQRRASELVRAGIVDATLTSLAVLAALPYGATAVAASLGVTGLLVRAPVSVWLATRHGPVTSADVYARLLPSLATAITVGAAIAALRYLVLDRATPPVLGLSLAVPLALLIGAAAFCVWPKSRRALGEFMSTGKLLLGNAS